MNTRFFKTHTTKEAVTLLPEAYTSRNADESEMVEIINEILSDATVSHEDRDTIIQLLLPLDAIQLYRLTFDNEILQAFCRNQPALHEHWVPTYLSQYPSITVKTLEGKLLTPYDFLMGSVLYSGAIGSGVTPKSRATLLNEACKWQHYDALLFRINATLKAVETHLNTPDNKKNAEGKAALDLILSDIKILSKTYWGIGYANAGGFYNKLSAIFKTLSDNPDILAKSAQIYQDQSRTFLEESVKNILIAYHCEMEETSQKIVSHLTKGKGILSLVTNAATFKDWSSALTHFKDWVGDESFIIIEKSAKRTFTQLTLQAKALETSYKPSPSASLSDQRVKP